MKLQQLAMISSCVGAVLIVAAMFVTYFVVPNIPASATWSDEDATAYSAASTQLHHDSLDASLSNEEVQQSKDEWQKEHRDKLEAAISKRTLLPRILRYAGFACVIVGMSFYVASKVRNEEE